MNKQYRHWTKAMVERATTEHSMHIYSPLHRWTTTEWLEQQRHMPAMCTLHSECGSSKVPVVATHSCHAICTSYKPFPCILPAREDIKLAATRDEVAFIFRWNNKMARQIQKVWEREGGRRGEVAIVHSLKCQTIRLLSLSHGVETGNEARSRMWKFENICTLYRLHSCERVIGVADHMRLCGMA